MKVIVAGSRSFNDRVLAFGKLLKERGIVCRDVGAVVRQDLLQDGSRHGDIAVRVFLGKRGRGHNESGQDGQESFFRHALSLRL